MTEFDSFFSALTEKVAENGDVLQVAPFPYQRSLATNPWPQLLDVPTGLGKTDAVFAAWLWKRLRGDTETPRRLVYCLPMRVLVTQTVTAASRMVEKAKPLFHPSAPPTVHSLLGGEIDACWELHPERPAIIVGTQDLLLSRALDRGYAMWRTKWPVHFGLLSNDAVWVLDETQLMGVGVETSAQLQGLRERLGTIGPTHTLWMSATLGQGQIATVDHARPAAGWATLSLCDEDRRAAPVRDRLHASKRLLRFDPSPAGTTDDDPLRSLAERVIGLHQERGGLTLVILNQVSRAQRVYQLLDELGESGPDRLGLVHSRYRMADRRRGEDLLISAADRIVVATQAVEAGVDVSATTLLTELAPWPSLVQRFGRLNRYGDITDATAFWLDLDTGDDKAALPYSKEELMRARQFLQGLEDVAPASLSRVGYEPPPVVRPVVRRRDLLELFDTTPDLCGHDLDVSRWVRDGTDTDVRFYWRNFATGRPGSELAQPLREDLCAVSIGAARAFLEKLARRRKKLSADERHRLAAWSWDPLAARWQEVDRPIPGRTLMLHSRAGGYDPRLGWTGETTPGQFIAESSAGGPPMNETSYVSDSRARGRRWVLLRDHLAHVQTAAVELSKDLDLPPAWAESLSTSALWHDVGKSHPVFQETLIAPTREHPEHAPPGAGLWAKSSHRLPYRSPRGSFRHELASALAWFSYTRENHHPNVDLVAYLVAAHHGKVRLSIRSMPDEKPPPETERRFARGVWDGDLLPEVELGAEAVVGPLTLDLSVMELGDDSWLERTTGLRDSPELGPFRLAFLEAVLRVADWRASAEEEGKAEETACNEKNTITVWQTAGPIVDRERRRALSKMTDEEAQEAFAQVVALWKPSQRREPASGLIELHRLLAGHEEASA